MGRLIRECFKKFVLAVIYIYYVIVHRIKVVGTENIPKEGALIFCGNHRSFLDPPLIKITAKRETFFLAKASLYKNPLLAFLICSCNCFGLQPFTTACSAKLFI